MLKTLVKSTLRRAGLNVSSSATPGHDLDGDTLRLGQPGNVILDVGANVGQSIRAFKAMFPDSRIHAFEPSAKAYGEATKAASGLPGVTVWNYAMGSEEGVADFREYDLSVMSSFLEPGRGNWSKPASVRQVQISTIDRYCADNRIDRIDILKIDVQGRGVPVLRGAGDMLSRHKVSLVRLELIFMDLYAGQDDPLETLRFMRDHGYGIVAFYEQHLRGDRLGWADVLFAPTAAP